METDRERPQKRAEVLELLKRLMNISSVKGRSLKTAGCFYETAV